MDILAPLRARERFAALAGRVAFEHRSIFELGLPDASFDLVVCRHVTQSIPFLDRVLAELKRVTKRGGWLHVLSEDYDMIHFQRRTPDPRDFWYESARDFTDKAGSNLFAGRETVPAMQRLGLAEIRMDYVTLDTLRAPRETFARIFEAWRDGYAAAVAQYSSFDEAQARAYFDTMAATIRDPNGYAVWHVPVASARVP